MYNTIESRAPGADILANAQASRFIIQDFRSLAQSVEWELGQVYLDRGSKAFAGETHIPCAVNNDGNLSVDAAEVFFDNVRTAEERGIPQPRLRVLELGLGLGLFARYFLDAFRHMCRERGKDYYDRLTYVAGDRSEKMLAAIGRRGVFANHLGHYELRVVDALRPDGEAEKGISLASGKAWERRTRCRKQIGNLSLEPCGYAIPSGRAGPAAGSESCVVSQ